MKLRGQNCVEDASDVVTSGNCVSIKHVFGWQILEGEDLLGFVFLTSASGVSHRSRDRLAWIAGSQRV